MNSQTEFLELIERITADIGTRPLGGAPDAHLNRRYPAGQRPQSHGRKRQCPCSLSVAGR